MWSRHSYCNSFPIDLMNVEQRQADANILTKPADLGR